MIKRLRKKFILIAMISVTAVMIIFCLTVNTVNCISVNSELTQMLEMIYDNQGIIPHDSPNGKPGVKPNGPFTKETPYSTRYFVLRFTDSGELSQANLMNISSVTQNDAQKYVDIAINHGEGFGYTRGYKYLVKNTGDNKWMAVFLDCYREMRSLSVLAIISFLSMLVCIAIVYAVVVLFSRRAIDPVVKASEMQKQFITDASHELKTPITVIATSLKVLEMETGKQKWIDKARAQTEKLKDLVNSLVALSRMDEEKSPLKFSRFNISEAVGEAANSFVDFSKSNGHELIIDAPPDIEYYGDEYAVRQLVSILIDNAIKYSSKNTPIEFTLKKAKKGVIISTKNECENVDLSELDKLFDRFYRADKSRSTDARGFGIGLSIARSIAQGHKGSICAKSENGHTVEFTAHLK